MEPTALMTGLMLELGYLDDDELNESLQQIAVFAIAAIRGLNGDDATDEFIHAIFEEKEVVVIKNDSVEH